MKLEEKFKNWSDGLTKNEVDVFGWYLDFEFSIANVYELLEIDDKIYKESKYDIVRKIRDYQIKCIDDFVSRRIKDIKNLNIALGFDENDVLLHLEHFRYLYEIRVNRYYGFKALEYMVKRNLNMINFEKNKINRNSFPVLVDKVSVCIKPSFLQCLPYDMKRGFVDSIIKMLDVESYRETIYSCESMDSLIELYEKHLDYYNSSNFRGTYELVMEDYLSIHEDKVNEVKTNKVGEMGVLESEVESNEKDLDEVVTVDTYLVVKDETSKEVEVLVEEKEMEKTTNDMMDKYKKPNMYLNDSQLKELFYDKSKVETYGFKNSIHLIENYEDKLIKIAREVLSPLTSPEMKRVNQNRLKFKRGTETTYFTNDDMNLMLSKYKLDNGILMDLVSSLANNYSSKDYLKKMRNNHEYKEFVFKNYAIRFTKGIILSLDEFKCEVSSSYPKISDNVLDAMLKQYSLFCKYEKYTFDNLDLKVGRRNYLYTLRRFLGLVVDNYDFNSLEMKKISEDKSLTNNFCESFENESSTNASNEYSENESSTNASNESYGEDNKVIQFEGFTEIQKTSMQKLAFGDYASEMLVSKFPTLVDLEDKHICSIISDLDDLKSKNSYEDVENCMIGALKVYKKVGA